MLRRRLPLGLVCNVSQCLVESVSLHFQRVQWFRVGNSEIPDDKRLSIALQRIHGVGRQRAKQILAELSLTDKLTRDMTGIEMNLLRDEVSKYLIADDLRRRVNGDVQRLIDNRCYRGYRHVSFLPCRGQRSKTNCRTTKEHKKQSNPNRMRFEGLADSMERRQQQEIG